MRSSGWGETALLEREAELAVLRAALTSAGGGRGSLVVVSGPPGAGKSRLLGAARDLAAAAGTAALVAQASELERDLPFGVAGQLLDLRAGWTPDGLRPDGATPTDVGYALIEHLREELLDRLRALPERRLLLVADDLQWSDPPSLRFLSHLALRLDGLPVALVVAMRQEDAARDELLHALLTHRLATVLTPAPLSAVAAGRLVRATLGRDVGEEVVAACVRASGGLPFYLVELVRELAANAAISGEDVERAVPATVLRAVAARLGRLGPAAVAIARALAVVGDGAALTTLAALAEVAPGAAEDAADALAQATFVAPGEPLRFTHPLIASTVRADMGAFARARMHRRAADLLERDGAPVERVAAHLLHCRPSGDAAAVARLCAGAALACRRGQPTLAVRLLERALAEPPAPGERGRVLLELAEAQAMAGLPAAVGNLEAALALVAHGRERVEASLALARNLHHAGRYGDAAAIADRCRRELPAGDPLAERALASWLASALLHPPLADQLVAEMEALSASAHGGTPSDPALCALLAAWLTNQDVPASRLVELGRAAVATDPLVDGDARGAAMGYAAANLVYADALEPAEALLDAAVAAARSRGAVIALAIARHFRCQLYLHRGRLADARAEGERSLEVVLHGWATPPWSTPTLTLVAIARGNLERAADMVRIGEGGTEGSVDWSTLLEARALLRLAQGRADEALTDARAAGAHSEGVLGVTSCRVFDWVRIAATAARDLGRRDEARELAAEALRRGESAGGRHHGAALVTAGVVAGGADGLEHLADAVTVLEGSAASLELARALLALGSALRHANRDRDAREPLLRALELAGPMGAAPLVARARAELAALGLRPRRPARAGPSALTPTERRVAELAGRGLTTPTIAEELTVSAKTVEFHLTRIYRKLGIAGRRDLPAALEAAAERPVASRRRSQGSGAV